MSRESQLIYIDFLHTIKCTIQKLKEENIQIEKEDIEIIKKRGLCYVYLYSKM